jgi:hypothetical protein
MKWIFSAAGWLLLLAIILVRVSGCYTEGAMITAMRENGSYDRLLQAELIVLAVLSVCVVCVVCWAIRCDQKRKRGE